MYVCLFTDGQFKGVKAWVFTFICLSISWDLSFSEVITDYEHSTHLNQSNTAYLYLKTIDMLIKPCCHKLPIVEN